MSSVWLADFMETAYTPTELQIHCGDIVAVNFNNAQTTLSHRATVLFMPSAPGDCWGFKDEQTGYVHYVSEGCTISKKLPSANKAGMTK